MSTMTMTENANQKLEQAVQLSGASREVILENALSRYLAELQEDAEDARLAEKSWKECEESGEQTYTISEVRRELGRGGCPSGCWG